MIFTSHCKISENNLAKYSYKNKQGNYIDDLKCDENYAPSQWKFVKSFHKNVSVFKFDSCANVLKPNDCQLFNGFIEENCMVVVEKGYRIYQKAYLKTYPITQDSYKSICESIYKGCLVPEEANLMSSCPFLGEDYFFALCSLTPAVSYRFKKDGNFVKTLDLYCPNNGLVLDEFEIVKGCSLLDNVNYTDCVTENNYFFTNCENSVSKDYKIKIGEEFVQKAQLGPKNCSGIEVVKGFKLILGCKKIDDDNIIYNTKCNFSEDKTLFFGECTFENKIGSVLNENVFVCENGKSNANSFYNNCHVTHIPNGRIIEGCNEIGQCIYACDPLYKGADGGKKTTTACRMHGFDIYPTCKRDYTFYLVTILLPLLSFAFIVAITVLVIRKKYMPDVDIAEKSIYVK
ncbi:hypothetical protein MHBO_000125 [Bonamia ostreae]|uniref:Uncharacterized protein n=1 Tax=Bonamia ostreae TaxID=126728 RepID=A0ABV2AEK5_9EUKA